jgi:choline dehydrogenase
MVDRFNCEDEWDYVIVGGGSAGCVLANRLSADPGQRVLLLEAGGWDRSPLIRIPAGTYRMPRRYNWCYAAAADGSRGGKSDTFAAGKVLGGGSSVNMTLWVRGERSDFDGWRDAGCPGWGYEDVLPYFKRSETYAGGANEYRGGSGPVAVRPVPLRLEVTDDFLAAAEEAGHTPNPDYNGERQQGVSLAQVSQRRGWRASTARAYLAPARKRPNLTIRTNALVTRIGVSAGRATGVEFQHDGQRRFARTTREVVLSAGAIASPKLLMLSGIGPAGHLREHSIDVCLDAPGVGANLQDHAYGMLAYSTTAGTLGEELRPSRALKHVADFAVRGQGGLTVAGGVAVVFSQVVGDYPTEAEIILMPIGLSFEGDHHDIHSVRTGPGVMVYPSHVHPVSRGSIRLSASSPAAPPVISHELVGGADMHALIAACNEARDIFRTSVMKARPAIETLPGDGVQTAGEWAGYLRTFAFRPHHPAGTCRMGSDDSAVVDPQLRLRGVEGLRVADASVFPAITSGNTNAPTIMVAERAADLILGRPGPGQRPATSRFSYTAAPSGGRAVPTGARAGTRARGSGPGSCCCSSG